MAGGYNAVHHEGSTCFLNHSPTVFYHTRRARQTLSSQAMAANTLYCSVSMLTWQVQADSFCVAKVENLTRHGYCFSGGRIRGTTNPSMALTYRVMVSFVLRFWTSAVCWSSLPPSDQRESSAPHSSRAWIKGCAPLTSVARSTAFGQRGASLSSRPPLSRNENTNDTNTRYVRAMDGFFVRRIRRP